MKKSLVLKQIHFDYPDFIKFLKKQCAYKDYLSFFKANKPLSKFTLISGAFTWHDTRYYDFWMALNRKWISFLNKNKTKIYENIH